MTVLSIIKSGSIYWKIVESDNLPDDLNGQTDFGKETITVRPGLSPAARDIVIWHELIHVLFYEMGSPLEDSVEEKVCLGLSHGLTRLQADNAHLARMGEW